MGEARGTDPPHDAGALTALFARISRNSERVILPINNIAADTSEVGPAFYCVHSLSGAGGTDYRDLAKLMPTVRFYGVQAPPKKMQDGEFGNSVQSIADYYAKALVKFQPEGRFLLGGWSAGAIIGLEIAQNLRARGREVGLFVAIDAAPENTDGGLRPWHPIYLLEVANNLVGWTVHNVPKKKSYSALIRHAINKAIAQCKTTAACVRGEKMVGAHAVEGFMDLSHYPQEQKSFMKRLYSSLLVYTAQSYSGNVVVYEAKVKSLHNLPQVGRIWRIFAPQSIIITLSGTHLSILREPYANELAEDLGKRITEAATAEPIYVSRPRN